MSNQPSPVVHTKKHLARLERERIQRRYLLTGVIIVSVLVVLVIAYGILDETVLKKNKPVAKVGDDYVRYGEFEDLVHYFRWQSIQNLQEIETMKSMFGSDPNTLNYFNQLSQNILDKLQKPEEMGKTVLDQLVSDQLVIQEAKRRGITVSDEEVEKNMQEQRNFFANGTPTPAPSATPYATSTLSPLQMTLVPPTATPTAAPTATPDAAATATATLAPTAEPTLEPTAANQPTGTPEPSATPYTLDGYKQRLQKEMEPLVKLGVSEEDMRGIVRMNLLRQKVFDALTQDVSTTKEEVWARHILVADEAAAQKVLERLKAGEDFAKLAAELSQDTSNKDQGGDLGWFGKGSMVKPFEDAVYALEIGKISDPVKTDFGYHIIQVLGHENRSVDPNVLQQDKQQAFNAWLEQAKKDTPIETYDDFVNKNVPTEPALEGSVPVE